jgi:hypothetical protein
MNKETFRALCEEILVPLLKDAVRSEFVEHKQTFESILSEISRVGDGLDHMAADLDALRDDDDR